MQFSSPVRLSIIGDRTARAPMTWDQAATFNEAASARGIGATGRASEGDPVKLADPADIAAAPRPPMMLRVNLRRPPCAIDTQH
jgi:hypothetical protein